LRETAAAQMEEEARARALVRLSARVDQICRVD
jgi:hypothetical protein